MSPMMKESTEIRESYKGEGDQPLVFGHEIYPAALSSIRENQVGKFNINCSVDQAHNLMANRPKQLPAIVSLDHRKEYIPMIASPTITKRRIFSTD